jgi:hypothetical protein
MIKKTIKFTDFNGNEHTEDLYFNINNKEILDMEKSVPGGLTNKLQKVTENQDVDGILEYIELLIDKGYGKKSDDGMRFLKSPEILADFKASPAYDEFFMLVLKDAKFAAEFIEGVYPATLIAEAKRLEASKK